MTKKKTFVPRHLLLRGKTYYVVLDIPKDVRAEFSFFRFCETTGERRMSDILCKRGSFTAEAFFPQT